MAVLLLLMLMSALGAALAVSGRTETLMARNHQSAAQARAAAEAGINHALPVVASHLFAWRAHGFVNVQDAVNALLADTAVLQPDVTFGTRLTVTGTIGYEVFLMDEDDPARGDAATDLKGDADSTNDEDGKAATDANRTLVIQAVGYADNGGSALVEAMLGPTPLPAIVTNGDFRISGHPTVAGKKGGVHANGALTLSGHPTIALDATASGTYDESGHPTVGGIAGGGVSKLPVPPIRAADFRPLADYILTANGQMTLPSGGVVCDAASKKDNCKKDYGVEFTKDGKGWEIKGKDLASGTYYVEGQVGVHDPGGSKKEPIQFSVIAEGSVDVHGESRAWTPDTIDLLLVTDGDLRITGGSKTPMTAQGQILVHEQLDISGHPELLGQILVEDAASVDNLATKNEISGHPTITYDGGLDTGVFSLIGWREGR